MNRIKTIRQWKCAPLLIMSLFVLAACGGDSNQAIEPATKLVSYERVSDMTSDDIAMAFEAIDVPLEIAGEDAVSLYSVEYNSHYDGAPAILSGLVVVPKNHDGPLKHFQYHHGTMLPIPFMGGEGALDVPSLYRGEVEVSLDPESAKSSYEVRMFGLGFASQGYFVSMPDYAGYGISSDKEHPYTYHPELAKYSADLALASRELAATLDLNLKDGVFLGGWSEGAGAALATHKYLEESYPELPVIATSSLAGPYHISKSGELAFEPDSELLTANIEIYNWIIYTYNKRSEMPIPNNQIWNYSVTSELEAIMVPSYDPEDVFSPFILSNDDSLSRILEAGDIHDGWVPKGKVFLHSGKRDNIVPHFNSTDTYNNLKRLGGDIYIYEYEGDHYEPAFDYYTRTLMDFSAL